MHLLTKITVLFYEPQHRLSLQPTGENIGIIANNKAEVSRFVFLRNAV